MRFPTVKIVYARDLQGALGKEGGLPWLLPADLAHFRRETLGSVCIMGRKTWDSIGRKGLPGRPCIVMTRQPATRIEVADPWTFAKSPQHALAKAAGVAQEAGLGSVSVIGGAQIYGLFWPLAAEVVETVVHARVDSADTWLEPGCYPDDASWDLVDERRHEADAKNKHTMDFLRWRRKA